MVFIFNLVGSFASAHEGYLSTYNHHIIPGEFEIMLMSDFTSPSNHKREKDGQNNYFSQMLELEYSPNSQLAFELMMEGFKEINSETTKFTGFRYETRYRPFKSEAVLFNPTLYLEYEDLHVDTRYKMEVSGWIDPPYEESGAELEKESILESRLILSQDFGRWNAAFNWINESDLHSGTIAFGYSLGFLYRLPQSAKTSHDHEIKGKVHSQHVFVSPVSIALEFLGALGDTKKFGLDTTRQEHYFQPSIMFHLGKKSMLNVGAALGLTKVSDNLIRVNWGWML
jgi:hypothetical protein